MPLPSRNLVGKAQAEWKKQPASGKRSSSKPVVDGSTLPISQLLNCFRTIYQNSTCNTQLSRNQSPVLKAWDTVFQKMLLTAKPRSRGGTGVARIPHRHSL